jgi:hypothetical protein
MKSCPLCLRAPDWHFCRHVTQKRADGLHYYMLCGCDHAMTFGKPMQFVSETDLPANEAKWDAEAERLFAKYTERWTEPQRTAFRVRVWRETPATTLNLQ